MDPIKPFSGYTTLTASGIRGGSCTAEFETPSSLEKSWTAFPTAVNFKAANLRKRNVKMSCSFQGIDLKSFHLYHLEWMLP